MEIDRPTEYPTPYFLKISEIQDDMGSNNQLSLLVQNDGDVVISLMDTEVGLPQSVEICQSGTRYPGFAKRLRQFLINEADLLNLG